MSRASQITLATTCAVAIGTVAFVHFAQKQDKAAMHAGVIRDYEQQRVKRERQADFEMQKALQEEYLKLTTAAAIGAAALYYTTSSSPMPANDSSASASSTSQSSKPAPASSSPSNASVSKVGHRHEAEYASDVPKPVEDRHGNTVSKHSIAARKNQDKLRVGKFSGEEFDNHELEHTPGKPGGDFEKKK
ncbi:hypothetical protein E8E11_007758 [Didymella keratinophila]|nr:hypothetical protein E8E11_007758 [Didymella keratinophila]